MEVIRGEGGDTRFEFCFFVSVFVVDRTFDLTCLLQELDGEPRKETISMLRSMGLIR